MKKKHTLKERLEEFVEYLDLTNQKFEQNAGLPNGFINKSGKYISDKSEQKIINTYPDLNMTWLLTGEGEMLKTAERQTELKKRMKANSQIRQNLLLYLDYRQESKSDFYKKSNLSNGFIDKLGDRLSIKSQSRISKAYPELNINWLLTGEGEMLNNGQKHLSQQTEPQINENSLDELYLLNKTIDILRENLERKDAQIESLFAIIRQFQNSL